MVHWAEILPLEWKRPSLEWLFIMKRIRKPYLPASLTFSFPSTSFLFLVEVVRKPHPAPPQWCESTLLEDHLRAALRVISALSALRWSKMIFRRFAQSRIGFSEKLRNMPSIIFSNLLESALHLEMSSIHKVFRERCLGRKSVPNIYVLREQYEMKL